MAFKMKSGNKPEFKSMGGELSPMKWGRLGKAFNKVNFLNAKVFSFPVIIIL